MATAAPDLERAREAYASRAWSDVHSWLTEADEEGRLEADDLELLATAAYMLGFREEYARHLDRAYRIHREAGRTLRAALCAVWLGFDLMLAGEFSQANGWFARAERLVEDEGETVVDGYLLIPVLLQATDDESARRSAAAAAEIGRRFGDQDLIGLTAQEEAHALIRDGRTEEGLRLLDETMMSVVDGSLSPIVTGLIYCNTITFCQTTYELGRAREWTRALRRWCDEQPEMVANLGKCLVHRAEIMEQAGAWEEALEQARTARRKLERDPAGARAYAGHAAYRAGEVHRLRGEFEAAEREYLESARLGWDPQPGQALLRLWQGRAEAAGRVTRRLVAERSAPLERLGLLPAHVEVTLACGEVGEARAAAAELDELADRFGNPAARAMARYARGAVALAEGRPAEALTALRGAVQGWRELDVPYEVARTRSLIAQACAGMGDGESAGVELGAARAELAALGARPDLERLGDGRDQVRPAGLTEREVEVLRLVAAGRTNRQIADELVVSPHTVARHLQNIFAKLGVSSRTAASAFAYERGLV